ncbi:MAG: hypothetical protein KDD14_19645 [Saprospiraceae bacterium]|nr:hypothetical protein [Saprospiraceae bacterium]
MKSIIQIAFFFFFTQVATAQIAADYQIEKRDSAFVLIQNGRIVPFDTAQVQLNLVQKSDEVGALETEIALLERLVLLRRQLALAREEKRTLIDIIEKARQCPISTGK